MRNNVILSPLFMQEAALIIWEGESNAKFYRHPTTKWSKRAYAILNNPFYHFFHFTVCNILLLLAVVELPSVEEDFITMDLYLKYLLPVSVWENEPQGREVCI